MYDAVYHVRKRAQRVEITGKDRKYELAADEIVVFEVYDHELKITLKDGEKRYLVVRCTHMKRNLKSMGLLKYRAQLCSIQDI